MSLISTDMSAFGLMLGFVAAKASSGMSREQQETAEGRSLSSADLLARCAAGDAKAFRQLYDVNSPRMYAVALRITGNTALAADAVHDAMLQVWRNAARYDSGRGDANGWLTSLARYRALDICRRQGRELTGVEAPERADEGPDALSVMAAEADGAALRTCLEQIDPPRRKLVLLAFSDGLTQLEVSKRVGQPLGTVKSTIRRALLALRSCLNGIAGPQP